RARVQPGRAAGVRRAARVRSGDAAGGWRVSVTGRMGRRAGRLARMVARGLGMHAGHALLAPVQSRRRSGRWAPGDRSGAPRLLEQRERRSGSARLVGPRRIGAAAALALPRVHRSRRERSPAGPRPASATARGGGRDPAVARAGYAGGGRHLPLVHGRRPCLRRRASRLGVHRRGTPGARTSDFGPGRAREWRQFLRAGGPANRSGPLRLAHGGELDGRRAGLRWGNRSLGAGRSEGLRSGIGELRAAGKKVAFYLESAGDLDYSVASAADRVYAAPQAVLAVNGFSATALFAGAGLDKLGVKAEFVRVGAYKTAPDVFTRRDMSSEQREVVNALLDDVFGR